MPRLPSCIALVRRLRILAVDQVESNTSKDGNGVYRSWYVSTRNNFFCQLVKLEVLKWSDGPNKAPPDLKTGDTPRGKDVVPVP